MGLDWMQRMLIQVCYIQSIDLTCNIRLGMMTVLPLDISLFFICYNCVYFQLSNYYLCKPNTIKKNFNLIFRINKNWIIYTLFIPTLCISAILHLKINWGYSTNGASRNINVRVIIHIQTTVKNSFMMVLKALKNIFCIVNFLYNYLLSQNAFLKSNS